MTAEAALKLKGLAYERIDFTPGEHTARWPRSTARAARPSPACSIDGEPVHGSRAILERLEELAPEPALYPEPIADAVREAERWGDEELQDLGRRLPWGALHFRPESMGTFGGAGPLDPAGTDFAIRYRARDLEVPRDHRRSGSPRTSRACPRSSTTSTRSPPTGIIGGDAPNAADLQIGATLRVLLTARRPAPAARGPRRRAARARAGSPTTRATSRPGRSRPAGCRLR